MKRLMILSCILVSSLAEPQPFLVIKRGNSGSTWFSTLLLFLKDLFFMDEAMSAKVFETVSRDAARRYLERAISRPTGQYLDATSRKPIMWKHQSKAAERCYVRRSRSCELRAIGLSVAPLAFKSRTAPPPWPEAASSCSRLFELATRRAQVPGAPRRRLRFQTAPEARRLASLERRQDGAIDPRQEVLFKIDCWATTHRAAALGTGRVPSILQTGRSPEREPPRARSPRRLDHRNSASRLLRLPAARPHAQVYEAVQLDTPGEMNRLRRFLGLPKRTNTTFASTSIKRGGEDLRMRVANFDALSALVEATPCLHAMLHAAVPHVATPCPAPLIPILNASQ